MQTEIVLDYEDRRTAEAIAKAVSPDNLKTPKGLSVKTTCAESKVITTIKCHNGFGTFIATIDDLLSCISTAEKTLQTAKRIN
jgi:tRNA threonylcarbamoyladenosine modification (KEOPS) complex  Pcc1 subunit